MAESLQIQRVSKAWHERIVDLEIEHPTMKLGEIARRLNVTPAHLSVVRNSDAFIEYRALRMREHQDRVSQGVVDRTHDVAMLGLNVLHERMEKQRHDVSLSLVKDVTEMTLKSLGYGAKTPQATNVQINTGGQHYHLNDGEREAYESARAKLKVVNEQNTESLKNSKTVENANVEDAEEVSEFPELPPLPPLLPSELEQTKEPTDEFSEFYGTDRNDKNSAQDEIPETLGDSNADADAGNDSGSVHESDVSDAEAEDNSRGAA